MVVVLVGFQSQRPIQESADDAVAERLSRPGLGSETSQPSLGTNQPFSRSPIFDAAQLAWLELVAPSGSDRSEKASGGL